MTQALILLALFLCLFLLSRSLTRSISHLVLTITRQQKIAVATLAFLFLPGTLLHEIAHFLMARILFVPAGNMILLPKVEGNTIRLGSVSIQQTDPIRRMVIGITPFLLGTTILFSLLLFATDQSFPLFSLPMLGIGYVVFEIGNTMFSSRKDLEGVLTLVLVLAAILILLYIAGIRPPEHLFQFLNSQKMITLFKQGSLLISVPILIDLAVILLLKFMQKILH